MPNLKLLMLDSLPALVEDKVLEKFLSKRESEVVLNSFGPSFLDLMFDEWMKPTGKGKVTWVTEFLQQKLCINETTDISAEDLTADDRLEILEPFVYAWSLFRKLDNQHDVIDAFARMSLIEAKPLLDDSYKLEAWILKEDEKLTVETMVDQNRDPEAANPEHPVVPSTAEVSESEPPSPDGKMSSRRKRRGKKPRSVEGSPPVLPE